MHFAAATIFNPTDESHDFCFYLNLISPRAQELIDFLRPSDFLDILHSLSNSCWHAAIAGASK